MMPESGLEGLRVSDQAPLTFRHSLLLQGRAQ
jgi:hypothetical protein